MSVPRFYDFMLPILRRLSDGQSWHWRELRDACAEGFELSEEDRAESTSGGQLRLDNRVLWANTYLFQAGLVDRPRRGHVQINDRGRQVLADPPPVINGEYLMRFPEYREFKSRTRQDDTVQPAEADPAVSEATPLESIKAAMAESTAARDYVERIPNRIILIDGPRLAELMELYNVGVQPEQTFILKRVDEDFFE